MDKLHLQSFIPKTRVQNNVFFARAPKIGKHKKRGCKISALWKVLLYGFYKKTHKGSVYKFYLSQETGFLKGFLFAYLATYLVFSYKNLNFIQTLRSPFFDAGSLLGQMTRDVRVNFYSCCILYKILTFFAGLAQI